MNIVFMGTPDFAVPCLNELIENNHNVIGVVTQPDKPKGRSGELSCPPVKEFAQRCNIDVFQPQKIRESEFVEKLKDINPDLIVVVAFGQILPESILNIPKYGCINVHGSLLPKYRGAAPIQWSIINGDEVTGVTTMYMDKGMDTGDIIQKREIEIGQDETADILFNRLSKLGSELLIETINKIQDGTITREKQDESQATKVGMLTKEIGNINWSKSALEIKNLIRGTYPWPGSYTYYKGIKVKLFSIKIDTNEYNKSPGTIVDVTKDSIVVQCGKGSAIIKEIQFESSRRMSVKDYLVGHAIDKNEILCGDNNGRSC